jgi:hypothetical protein
MGEHDGSAGAPRRLQTIERAFELARSGSCRTIEEIVRRLKQEHMDKVDAHLGGASIRKELRQACAQSRTLRAVPDVPEDIAAE